jgi:diadenosine tetraphosphate (Ap4A) HIT family hydrolase
MKNESKTVDLINARKKRQIKVMKEIIAQGCCPFCKEHLFKFHEKPIIKEGKFWLLTQNQWPYNNVQVQFLIISKKHIENISEVEPEASAELMKLAAWAMKKYRIKGGAICMRFGSTKHSGATVKHLHAQLIEPDLNRLNYKPIRFYIGSKTEKS